MVEKAVVAIVSMRTQINFQEPIDKIQNVILMLQRTTDKKTIERTTLCKNYDDNTLKGGITERHCYYIFEDDICRCIQSVRNLMFHSF